MFGQTTDWFFRPAFMMSHIRDEVANSGGPGSPSTSKIDDGFNDDAGLESLLASVLSGELSVLGANPQTLPGMGKISADSDELTPRSTPGDILSHAIGIEKMSSPRGSSLPDEVQNMDEDARMGSGVRELDRRPAEVSGRPPARLSDPATDAVSGSSRPDVRDASFRRRRKRTLIWIRTRLLRGSRQEPCLP